MAEQFKTFRALPDDWQRAKQIRLRALADSPEWFSGDFERESARKESDWRSLINSLYFIIFTAAETDVAMMTLEKADPIRGTDCWLGGCWVEPGFRGKGITKVMVDAMDEICALESWKSQGLGVWPNNQVAIRAYLRAGFAKVGEPQPSRSKPGQLFQMMFREAGNSGN